MNTNGEQCSPNTAAPSDAGRRASAVQRPQMPQLLPAGFLPMQGSEPELQVESLIRVVSTS